MHAEAEAFDLDDPFAIAEHRAKCLREAEVYIRCALAEQGHPLPLVELAVAKVLACAAAEYDAKLQALGAMLDAQSETRH